MNPWKQGNYWDVSSIHVKDGSGLKYAQFLASSWVKNQEFAKSQGDVTPISRGHLELEEKASQPLPACQLQCE